MGFVYFILYYIIQCQYTVVVISIRGNPWQNDDGRTCDINGVVDRMRKINKINRIRRIIRIDKQDKQDNIIRLIFFGYYE